MAWGCVSSQKNKINLALSSNLIVRVNNTSTMRILLCVVLSLGILSDSLGSNMVLQSSPASARIWGWTSLLNEIVRVKFNGQSYTAVSTLDEFGNNFWSLDLPPTPVSYPHFCELNVNGPLLFYNFIGIVKISNDAFDVIFGSLRFNRTE